MIYWKFKQIFILKDIKKEIEKLTNNIDRIELKRLEKEIKLLPPWNKRVELNDKIR
jgi:hypothetical protein